MATRYGNSFAQKASPQLTQALATVSRFASEAVSPRPRPTILEFSPITVQDDDVSQRSATLFGPESATPAAMRRLVRARALQEQFALQVANVVTELDKRSAPVFPAGLEAVASATVPSSVIERCWLNQTMRTFVDPASLRDIADEKTLQTLDLPRKLTHELSTTANTIRAIAFQTTNSIDGLHIKVAVIDQEIDIKHPALSGRVIQGANHTSERWGFPGPHGTAVAGIIASSDAVYKGIAPAATLINYKIFASDPRNNATDADDFGGTLALQQALEDGAQIANCSWGCRDRWRRQGT